MALVVVTAMAVSQTTTYSAQAPVPLQDDSLCTYLQPLSLYLEFVVSPVFVVCSHICI